MQFTGATFGPDCCEICGICEWQGKPLSLALHHVNGDGFDNRLENLQLLCPNCHAQTPTFSARNIGRSTLTRHPAGEDCAGNS